MHPLFQLIPLNSKQLLFILFFFLVASSANANAPHTFAQAKHQLRLLFATHRQTLYCHCTFNAQLQVDLASCNMQSANDKPRAHRIEVEHMMPAENFGHHFKCWREPRCLKKNGKAYKGRACCEKVDTQFRQAESELYNLWPAVGLVNSARSNYRYGIIDSPPDFYGCPMHINVPLRRAEPPPYAKGTVARANLFMSERYRVRLSDSQRHLFEAWNKQFPADSWELEWASKVAAIEGYNNPYIKNQ